ncbi:alpha-1,2-fucosyltransferase [Coraliomargarita sp. W4R72]
MMNSKFRVLLCGGLGNQLFQYAFGRALTERYSGSLEIDIRTGFARDFQYKRNYELDVFSLASAVRIVTPSKLGAECERVKLALARRRLLLESRYLIEGALDGAEDFRSLPARHKYTLFGYWQSQRYFSDIEAQLREELRFKRELSTDNQEIAAQMRSEASVALHVRRLQYDCAIDPSYYDRVIPQMLDRVPDAKFYCFSDELNWCREHLQPKFEMELIDNRELPAIEDFQLMSQCRHFITANSSFSWWAAWLGGRAGQVLTPALDMRHRIPQVGDRPGHWQSVS